MSNDIPSWLREPVRVSVPSKVLEGKQGHKPEPLDIEIPVEDEESDLLVMVDRADLTDDQLEEQRELEAYLKEAGI